MSKGTLDPETRLLYGDSLQPPFGYRFDAGVATTFSLDFETALAVPVSLAFSAATSREDILQQPLELLEGAERIADRLVIFTEAGQIHAGSAQQSRLCSLLEKVIVEVKAPNDGSFHPKIWALRFKPLEGEGEPLLRLLVLSRNLTRDKSWDVAVRLDGRPTRRPKSHNRPLHTLISSLTDLAVGSIGEKQRALCLELASDMRHADWVLPQACDAFEFSVNGLSGRPWQPESCTRIGLVSPFCDDKALRVLSGKATKAASVLISRPDQLACISSETLDKFDQISVMEEHAEREDGEEAGPSALDGLHAKIIVAEHGWHTRLTLGSGNATSPAFVTGNNVEFFITLTGKTSKLGSIDSILGDEGFGRLTRSYAPGEIEAVDNAQLDAERDLLFARRALARGGLRLSCENHDAEGAGNWRLCLIPPEAGIALPKIESVRVWLITRGQGHSVEALQSLVKGEPLDLGVIPLADVTHFVAIEIKAQDSDQSVLFSTGLEVEGLPEGRDAAVMQSIITDRKSFLRYLRLLLTALIGPTCGGGLPKGKGSGDWSVVDDEPLLEELVRALCANDGRLDAVDRVMTKLSEPQPNCEDPIPEEFRATWQAFRAVMGSDHREL